MREGFVGEVMRGLAKVGDARKRIRREEGCTGRNSSGNSGREGRGMIRGDEKQSR